MRFHQKKEGEEKHCVLQPGNCITVRAKCPHGGTAVCINVSVGARMWFSNHLYCRNLTSSLSWLLNKGLFAVIMVTLVKLDQTSCLGV